MQSDWKATVFYQIENSLLHNTPLEEELVVRMSDFTAGENKTV